MKKSILTLITLLGLSALAAQAQQWGAPLNVNSEGDMPVMVRALALTENRIVVVYLDHNTKGGKAVLCERSGDALSKVSETSFDGDKAISGASTFALARLSDSQFILCYQDTSPLGKALIGNVDGAKIQWASETVFTGQNKGEFYDVAVLPNQSVVFIYHGASNKRGYVAAAEIMEDTIIMGPGVEINPAGAGSPYINQFNSILAMGDGRFVIAWSDANKGGQGFARSGQVVGTTITMGSTVSFSDAATAYTSLAKIDDSRFGLAYRDSGLGSKPSVRVGVLESAAIQFGEKAPVPADGVSDCVTAAPLSGDIFAVSYRNNDLNRESPIHLCRADGTTLRVTPKYVSSTGNSNQQLLKLDDENLLLVQLAPGFKAECRVFHFKYRQ